MKRVLGRSVAAVVLLILALTAGVLIYDASRHDRLAAGVQVAGVPIGGMTAAQAREALRLRLGSRFQRPVEVVSAERRFTLGAGESKVRLDERATVAAAVAVSRRGNPFSRTLRALRNVAPAHADVKPVVKFDPVAVDRYLHKVAERINRRPRDADIDFVGYRVRRQPARNGVKVRTGEVARAVRAALRTGARAPIAAPLAVTQRPDLTLNELRGRYRSLITVSRRRNVLRLYRRLRHVKSYRISVGTVGHRTPAGRYKIQSKVVNPPWNAPDATWAGEFAGQTIPPDDPRNPLKARWMEFHDGAGIHGTDDVRSLGDAASHGCIRMSIREVKELFKRVRVGTTVFID